nr:hypothetical protein 19 [Paracoccaceae bacterium]
MTTSAASDLGPDWSFDYSEMTEQEALAHLALQLTKCKLLCETDYCNSICQREYNNLLVEIGEYFEELASFSAADFWFCVQRGGKDYRVLGRDMHDKLQNGDRFVVWRDGKPFNWKWAEVENVWEQQDTWFHLKNLTEEMFLYPRDEPNSNMWDINGNPVDRLLPGGEYVVGGVNDNNARIRFEGNTGSWDFGDLTDVHLLKNGFRLFADCPNFNGDVTVLGGTPWTDVREIFRNATSFNQDIGHWDVNNVQNGFEFNYVFNNAASFDQDVSNWCGTSDIGLGFLPESLYDGCPLQTQPRKQINMLCRI